MHVVMYTCSSETGWTDGTLSKQRKENEALESSQVRASHQSRVGNSSTINSNCKDCLQRDNIPSTEWELNFKLTNKHNRFYKAGWLIRTSVNMKNWDVAMLKTHYVGQNSGLYLLQPSHWQFHLVKRLGQKDQMNPKVRVLLVANLNNIARPCLKIKPATRNKQCTNKKQTMKTTTLPWRHVVSTWLEEPKQSQGVTYSQRTVSKMFIFRDILCKVF